jgi:hypothetical protein
MRRSACPEAALTSAAARGLNSSVRSAPIALLLCAGCGADPGGGGVTEPVDPLSAVFILAADRLGDATAQGQVAVPGAVSVLEADPGCVIPAPPIDEPVALASFLGTDDPDLRDIGDIGFRFPAALAIARFTTPPFYRLMNEDLPFPEAGSSVEVFADEAYPGFEATLTIGQPPTIVAPADGSSFLRTADLPMTIDAHGASGIVVDMHFSNDARALCFFAQDGDIVIPQAAIGEDTFLVTGPTEILVGSWVIGHGGTGGMDVNLVTISNTGITLQME